MYNLHYLFRSIMKRFAVAFTGPSGSGKTTLVEKIAKTLIKQREVAIIKHDPSDKAVFDKEGKDSHKFSQTGAEVVVCSPTRTTYFSQKNSELEEIIRLFNHFDILLVEGLKSIPLPRIAIFRNKIEEYYLNYSEAIAIDQSININEYNIPNHIDILDLNNTTQIIEWIDQNAKEI